MINPKQEPLWVSALITFILILGTLGLLSYAMWEIWK